MSPAAARRPRWRTGWICSVDAARGQVPYGRQTFFFSLGPGDQLEIHGPVPSDWSMTPASSQVKSPSSTAAGEPLVGVVGVGPQPLEQLVDPQPGLLRRTRRRARRPPRPGSGRRRGASRAREQAAAIANSSAPMSTIRPRKPCRYSSFACQRRHAVERLAGQLARRPLDVAQVLWRAVRTRRTTSGTVPLPADQLRQPLRVEAAGLGGGLRLARRGRRRRRPGRRPPRGGRRRPRARSAGA